MEPEKIEEAFVEFLERDVSRTKEYGEYHPSTISGCALKGFLERAVETESTINSWIFQGIAVHEYLENEARIDSILSKAGYHPLDTRKEVNKKVEVSDEITINGTCDVICKGEDGVTIFDLKYSSLLPEYGHGRIYQYLSQANTYAFMFGAEEYGLIMIHSKSDDLKEGINVLEGQKSAENWDIVKSKADMIHRSLEKFVVGRDEDITMSMLEDMSDDAWLKIFDIIDHEHCPSYEEECNYCAFSDVCPIPDNELGLKDKGAMGNKLTGD